VTVDETRDLALGALYAADSRSMEEIDVTKVPRDAGVLADRVWSNRERIDAAISAASTHWRIERMPTVDRNVLRLGTYELLYTELPIGVPINECVELAKLYGAASSGSFVNGVLSAVADQRDSALEDSDPSEAPPSVSDSLTLDAEFNGGEA
jgi:N utilization substance protein B